MEDSYNSDRCQRDEEIANLLPKYSRAVFTWVSNTGHLRQLYIPGLYPQLHFSDTIFLSWRFTFTYLWPISDIAVNTGLHRSCILTFYKKRHLHALMNNVICSWMHVDYFVIYKCNLCDGQIRKIEPCADISHAIYWKLVVCNMFPTKRGWKLVQVFI